jgi:hypothetical protein
MKKLLIPVLIAVLAGVGGGSGFAYMRASKAYVADSTQLADSLKAHPPAAQDSLAPDSSAHAATPSVHVPTTEVLPMTPADSIRAVEESRASLHGATKGLPDAAPPAPVTADPKSPDPKHATTKPDPKHPEPTAVDPKHAAPVAPADAPKPGSTTASVANIVRDARNEAMNTALPEQRLSKIFAAMSAKDAAKVMEQMPDADVRAILAMMSDRTAAAVLSQFPAARAAAITKGATRAPESKP